MADRGARNLILLSRSGAASLPAKELVRDLTARGIKVATPPCDVTDYGALRSVLRECSTYMPAVKGCIQGAMVLKVRYYVHDPPGDADNQVGFHLC